ncbi:MAG: hypothetical protein HY064_14430 [Bacteroidetes bacterium]|nr:hypothetical protein [Bacteroidota bacterium]
MKTNQEILDEFGQKVIKEVFDRQYKFIVNKVEDLAETKEYKNLFQNMTDIQKKEIEHYTYHKISGTLFDFLRVLEENEEFKLYYENGGQKENLADISEMLKAEPIIENGWIKRFSKFADKINFDL